MPPFFKRDWSASTLSRTYRNFTAFLGFEHRFFRSGTKMSNIFSYNLAAQLKIPSFELASNKVFFVEQSICVRRIWFQSNFGGGGKILTRNSQNEPQRRSFPSGIILLPIFVSKLTGKRRHFVNLILCSY